MPLAQPLGGFGGAVTPGDAHAGQEAPLASHDAGARCGWDSPMPGGERAVVLAGSSPVARAELLDALLTKLPCPAVRIGNPLSSALTLHRLLIQLGAGLDDAGPGDGGVDGPGGGRRGIWDDDAAALLLQRLDAHADGIEGVVLAVEEAHTLAADALAALARVPSGPADGQPQRRLILSGAPDLLRKVRQPGLEPLHDPAQALTVRLDDATEDGPAETPDDAPDKARADAAVSIPLPPPVRRTPVRMPDVRPPDMPGAGAPQPAAPQPAASRLAGLQAAAPPRVKPGRALSPVMGRSLLAGCVAALAGGALILVWPAWEPPASASAAAPARPDAPQASAPMPVSAGQAAAGQDTPGQTPALDAGHVPPGSMPTGPAPPAASSLSSAPLSPALPTQEDVAPGLDPRRSSPVLRAARSDEQVRREFEAFLDRDGQDTARLDPAARASLFRDYLAWRARNSAHPAARSAPEGSGTD